MLTNKLCNPTPFDEEIEWDRGIIIHIPAYSEAELTMDQMDDFRSGKPGSEEALALLNFKGLFLLDGDRTWEEQAAKAIEVSLKEKQDMYENFVLRTKDARIAQGSPVDDDAIVDLTRRSGHDKLLQKCELLREQLEHLRKILSSSGTTKGKVREDLDPKRTCFITKPPKQFPSETALELFLMGQSAEFRAQHEEYKKNLLGEDNG